MDDKNAISITELNSVVTSLKNQKQSLSDARLQIKNVLDSSSSCLSVSGLSYADISEAFDKTFNDLDNRFDALIKILETDVIKNYLELISVIRKVFNQEFASRISDLLEISGDANSGINQAKYRTEYH